MLDRYTKDVAELTEWYIKTKELVIKVEALDKKAYIQPLHELRYSYDHFIRALIYEAESSNLTEGKIKKAILSAKGHLVRAYSDCIEWLLVTVKAEYERVLQVEKMMFAYDEILLIIPEYPEIKENLQRLTDAVSAYKINKKNEEDENFNPIEELENPLIKSLCAEDGFFDGKYADLLKKYYARIHNTESQFAKVKRRKFTMSTFKNVLLPVITCVVGGLIVYLITKC